MKPLTTYQIPLPKEFDYQINLDYLTRQTNECLYRIEDKSICRLIPTTFGAVLVEISYLEAPSHCLTVQLLAETQHLPEKQAEIVLYIREWFDLTTDLTGFYQMGQQDILLQEPIAKFYGLRLIGIPDLFEALAWGILGQQINLAFAYTLKQRLVEAYGSAKLHEGQSYWSFPTPEKIAQLEVADLLPLQLSQRKSEYLIGVAQLIASGELTKDKLLELPDFQACEKSLVKIRGIGPWTANYVLMRCLRFPTAFPIDDIGLINAIKYQLQLPEKPEKAIILSHAQAWKGWESYATFYLWRLLY